MKNSNPTYSIVIPVYKSGAWMDELVCRVGGAMTSEAPDDFELVLVNDCSPDGITWTSIKRNALQYGWVRGINLLYNVGQFRATMCGLYHARGRFVMTMDDDLQHLPEELPKLIAGMREFPDALCVMGRYEVKRHSLIRNMGSRIFQRTLNRVYGKPVDVQTTSFRIMRRELVDALLACRTSRPQISPLIVTLTRKIKNVNVRHAPRAGGTSGYGFAKLVRTTFDNVVNASTAPLKFFSMFGLLSAGGSMVLALSFLIRWLSGGIGVAGYTSQILLITFFGGMTLASVGVVGEYVARIIAELTGPEVYRIAETTDSLQVRHGDGYHG